MNLHKFIIIIPSYNNPKTIKDVVKDVKSHNYDVIVIDDGSEIEIQTLFTKDEQKSIYFIKHSSNQGKGMAIVSGIKKAKELGYSHVLSIDADGQHFASQATKLIKICTGDEIIIGARNFNIKNVPNSSKFGRWISNFGASLNTRQKIIDSLSGYRIYPISILDLHINSKRYDWEMEVLVKHAHKNKIIKETIIECYYPTSKERVSHFNTFRDTVSIIYIHIKTLPYEFIKFLNIFNKN